MPLYLRACAADARQRVVDWTEAAGSVKDGSSGELKPAGCPSTAKASRRPSAAALAQVGDDSDAGFD